jgi:hypothetical protein
MSRKILNMVYTSEFFFGDKVPFSASDSGSLQKCTNQSQSLPHFVAKKKFTGLHLLYCLFGSF